MIAAATGAGTASSTSANAPASCERQRVVEQLSAASAVRPWARKPPSRVADCGVRPMWPITPMFDSAIARTRDGHPARALELDDVGAALLDEPDRARDRLLVGDLVAAERQVADDERPPRRARDRPGQEDHLVEGHRQRRLVPEHHHRRGVADEDQLDAGLRRRAAPRARRRPSPSRSCRRGASSRRARAGAASGAGATGRAAWAAAHRASPASRTLSIRRVAPTRAASASVGPSRSATST